MPCGGLALESEGKVLVHDNVVVSWARSAPCPFVLKVPRLLPRRPFVTRASFAKGSRYMRLRDEFGAVFDDARFAGLSPARGRPAEAPW